MSRKTARTLFSRTKRKWLYSLPILAVMAISCGDNNKEDEPDNPEPEKINAIVGKWQKYQRIQDDGSLTSADPNEFWIFEEDYNFTVIDSGDITDKGTYEINGMTLTISSYNVSEPDESEVIRGFYEIKDGYMNYQYTVVGEEDYVEYRFRKIN